MAVKSAKGNTPEPGSRKTLTGILNEAGDLKIDPRQEPCADNSLFDPAYAVIRGGYRGPGRDHA